MSDNLIVIAENDIHAGQLENLRVLIGEMIETIRRDEPGTLNYEWFVDDENKTVHVYERYADAEACITHLRALGQNYGERLFACLTVTKIAIYGNPSNEVRAVFASYATLYRSPFVRFAR